MNDKRMTPKEVEHVYDLIAEGIDQAGEYKSDLFLAKLSLALANLVGDAAKIASAVQSALRDL